MTTARKTEPRDLFRGALEMMILQSLRRQPMHGYALVQHIKQRSQDLLRVRGRFSLPGFAAHVESKTCQRRMGNFS
jgi:Transcriptional regulator PadR-like family